MLPWLNSSYKRNITENPIVQKKENLQFIIFMFVYDKLSVY